MKIVRRDFVRNGPGSVKMVPEDSDDLWYSYNLIASGDSVMAVTFRKVQREIPGGGRDSERVRLKLEVQVEEVDFDKDASVLRIRGKNILENEHVKIGAFHTLELDLKRAFVLRKEIWDSLALDTLKQASDPAASADLAVVLMQEGLAHIFLVGRSVTSSRARIETSIPRKHGPAIAGYESALKKFFENVLQAFVKHVDFSVVRCAVIASPGFTKLGPAMDQNMWKLLMNEWQSKHFSSRMSFSGEQLAQLTGIAALLRFPLPDLEDIDM